MHVHEPRCVVHNARRRERRAPFPNGHGRSGVGPYLWAAGLESLGALTGKLMQTSTTAAAPAPYSWEAPPKPRGSGLALATAIVAFASAALGIAAIFPRWDSSTTLHDTFANIENNLLFVVVLVVAGVFMLVSRSQWVRAAAALLLVGGVVGYLPGIGSNVGVAVKDGGLAAGFWIGQLSNLAAVAAVAMALTFALRSGVWSWRPTENVQAPVLTTAIGFLAVLMAVSWTLSVSTTFDSSSTLVNEQFGPLASRLGETSGFVVGAAFVVLALLVVVCTRPITLSGFLLLGLTVAGVADIFGADLWGFDASQGGTVGPGPGTALGYLVTVGLLFVAVVLTTSRVEEQEQEPESAPPTAAAGYTDAMQVAPPATPGPGYPVPGYPDATQAAPPPPPPPPIAPETQDLLDQLDDLHARGLLSSEELAAKRAQALGG